MKWQAVLVPLAAGFKGGEVTPLCFIGAGSGLYLATACIVAYRFSGHNGIDASQCLGVPRFRALEHDK